MYKVIRLETIEQISELFTKQTLGANTNRYRSAFVYRGMPNEDFDLVTTLKRNCKDKQKELESAILKSFSKYAVMESPEIIKSCWNQMIVGQHHGLPTRLLDWTHSPLVALHFATVERNMDKMENRNGCMWRLDMNELNELLPDKYKTKLKNEKTHAFSVEMLSRLANEPSQYDEDMGDSSMIILEPPSVDERIVSQNSFFSVVPMGMGDIEEFLSKYTNNTVKYIVAKELRWRIRDMLDQLMFNERMLFPGLDGLSQWLERHYYVRETEGEE